MGFTTTTFLFAFLPLVLLFYFIFAGHMKKSGSMNAGNIVIIIFSFVFYAWALKTSAFMLLLYTLIIFLIGMWIGAGSRSYLAIPYYSGEEKKEKRIRVAIPALIVGLVIAIALLYRFKYHAIIAPLVSPFFYINPDSYSNITVPLGISFITFSAISYFVDIYKNDAPAGSFFDCMLYMFFFPKVVSGPIVLWKDFHPQIKTRTLSTASFVDGINLIAIGFAKKVILADTFGLYLSKIRSTATDTPTAWLTWILYAFQIYYDFAGYSDIAIGISKMFGFEFAKNFDFPYRSLSITEFWRRWHISLGTFFRNYIYIPLGGNRKGAKRTLINLAIVFIITGIWHGAGMAYIIWGCAHGLFVLIERVIKDKSWYIKIPAFFKWIVTFFISASLWQFFRFGGNGSDAIKSLAGMFGVHIGYSAEDILFSWQFYIDPKIITFLIIGFLGATLLGSKIVKNLYEKIKDNVAFYIVKEVVIIGLMFLSIVFMVSSTYSPFIYFQF